MVEAQRSDTRAALRGAGAIACRSTDAGSEFEAVFLEHYQRVFGILSRVVGDRAQAEELASEVFWKLSRQPVHWLLTNRVGAWLYRTAVHAGIDALRATTHRRRHENAAVLQAGNTGTGKAGPLDELLRDEERRVVRRVLTSMKPAQAQLLLMRASGSSYKELAEILEVAVGGVGTLLNRAEVEFRKRYLKLTEKKEDL